MFHTLANSNANALIGAPKNDDDNAAWNRTHRALEHGAARSRFQHTGHMEHFPRAVREFADTFNELQRERQNRRLQPGPHLHPLRRPPDNRPCQAGNPQIHRRIPRNPPQPGNIYPLRQPPRIDRTDGIAPNRRQNMQPPDQRAACKNRMNDGRRPKAQAPKPRPARRGYSSPRRPAITGPTGGKPMRSTTRVLWLTIITLMAVLTACAGTPPSPPAALTAGTGAAEIVPEDPGRAEEAGIVSENPSRAENMTENKTTQSTSPHQARLHQDTPAGKRY